MTVWIPWIFVTGFVVSVAGLWATVTSLRSGESSWGTVAVYAVFAILFGSFVAQWLLWSAFVKPRIVPYFARELGPLGGPTASAFRKGRAIYLAIGDLEQAALDLDVSPLTAFGFADDYYGQEMRWHPPEDGLRTVEGLRRHAAVESAHQAALADDLDSLASVLQVAARQNVPFALVLRLYRRDSAQGVSTLQPRQGSFW